MNYICEECGFLFSRMGEIKECPSCEKHHIRSATGEEIGRLKTLLDHEKTIESEGKLT